MHLQTFFDAMFGVRSLASRDTQVIDIEDIMVRHVINSMLVVQ